MATDNDVITEAQEALEAAWVQDRENREDAFQDLKFLAGDQWPEAIRLQREAQNRPCLTINRLPQFVNQVANNVRQNPPGIKAIPAGAGASQEIAEIYTGLLREIQYRSNATHVFATAAYYGVGCGIGHFRITTDYIDDDAFDQEILIKRIQHPLSVYWDPDAVEPDRSDADYCVVSELIDRKAFEKKYPNASEVGFDLPSDNTIEGGLFWSNRDAVRLAEYWKKEPVEKTIARTESGEIIDITDVSKKDLAQLGIAMTRKVKSHKIVSRLMSGVEVLEETEWLGRYIPIFPVIGSEVALETKVIRHGLIRFARDPQQLHNFWRSAAAEMIALQPRTPWMVTPSMIAQFKTQWDTQNTVTRPYMLYNPDPDAPGERPTREAPPAPPQALWEEANMTSDEMKSVTGIYDASLGARSNEISGVAIKARENQGDNSALHYQDNLTATLNHLGRALVDLIPKIYDSERVLHILGEDGNPQQEPVHINVPVMSIDGKPMLLNDMTVGAYDIRVKIGPAYATQRAEAADSMLQFIQAVPQAASLIGDLVAQNMDWPGADEIAKRLQHALPPGIIQQEQPPNPQQQQQQAQAQQVAQAATAAKLQQEQGKAMEAHGKGVEAQARAAQAVQEAQAGPQQQAQPQVDPAQQQMTNALNYQKLREAGARADQAEVSTQGKILDNAIKRVRFTVPDQSNL